MSLYYTVNLLIYHYRNLGIKENLHAPAFLTSKLYTYNSVKTVQSNWATSVMRYYLVYVFIAPRVT